MKRVLFCLMALCIAALPALQQTAMAGEAAPTEFDPGTHRRVLGISQQLRSDHFDIRLDHIGADGDCHQ